MATAMVRDRVDDRTYEEILDTIPFDAAAETEAARAERLRRAEARIAAGEKFLTKEEFFANMRAAIELGASHAIS